ncbi:MAG: Hpt domain-containing protein [Lachnospiraceae bacterium]
MTDSFKNELINAGVDYEGAVTRFVGSEEIYEQFLYRFTDDKNLSQLEECLLNGDIGTAFKRAHTLKGLSGNYGFNKMLEATLPVVEILREGTAEGIEEPLEELKRINNRICGIINKYKNK